MARVSGIASDGAEDYDLRKETAFEIQDWFSYIINASPSLHASRAVTWLTVYRAPQVCLAQAPGQIAARMLGLFSENIFTKSRYLATLWSDFAEELPK